MVEAIWIVATYTRQVYQYEFDYYLDQRPIDRVESSVKFDRVEILCESLLDLDTSRIKFSSLQGREGYWETQLFLKSNFEKII